MAGRRFAQRRLNNREVAVPRTSLDLVPPWMTAEQLHGSYMGSIIGLAEKQMEMIPMMERIFTMLGAPPAA